MQFGQQGTAAMVPQVRDLLFKFYRIGSVTCWRIWLCHTEVSRTLHK